MSDGLLVRREEVSPRKVLIVRTDNLGDLILTAPLQTWLTKNFSLDVFWMVDSRFAYVLKSGGVSAERILSVSKSNGFIGKIKSVFEILKLVRPLNFEGACVCFATWPIAAALFLSRIPLRVGVFSKWWGAVFYTKPIRQRRSRAAQHESQYNLDMAREFVCELSAEKNGVVRRGPSGDRVDLHSADLKDSWTYFELTPSGREVLPSLPSQYVVVHPGMAGSALNWPAKKYFELTQKILSTNTSVVVTGTESDRPFVSQCGIEKLPGVISLIGKTDGDQILDVLGSAKAVIAPSTGVVHLAASLGVPTIGIYSPIRVEHPNRWGPKGPKAEFIVADQSQCRHILCRLGRKCPHFNYMETILVDKVFSRLTNVIGK